MKNAKIVVYALEIALLVLFFGCVYMAGSLFEDTSDTLGRGLFNPSLHTTISD